MILNKTKNYQLFFIVTILMAIIGIYNFCNETTLDINIHDTYYVIPHFYLAIALCFFYFLQGLFYWLVEKKLKRKLVRWLTIIHCFILIGSFIFYWALMGYYTFFYNANPLFDNSYQIINITLTISTLLIFFIGLPAYAINLIIGIFRKPI